MLDMALRSMKSGWSTEITLMTSTLFRLVIQGQDTQETSREGFRRAERASAWRRAS